MKNKYLIAILLAMCVIGFSLSSVSAGNNVVPLYLHKGDRIEFNPNSITVRYYPNLDQHVVWFQDEELESYEVDRDNINLKSMGDNMVATGYLNGLMVSYYPNYVAYINDKTGSSIFKYDWYGYSAFHWDRYPHTTTFVVYCNY